MSWIRVLWSRLGGLVRSGRAEQRVQEELRAHLNMLVEENLRRGMTAEAARHAAYRELGNTTSITEVYREQHGLPFIETLIQDLRYSLRVLGKAPGFTAITLAVIALGIAVNTAVFSLVDGVLLRSLPYPHPDRLVAVFLQQKGDTSGDHPFGTADFLAWREHQHSFEHVAAHDGRQNYTLTGLGNPEKLIGFGVTADFFSTLGAHPLLGHTFSPDADRPGKPLEAVVGESFWRNHLGGDPTAIGRTITLDSSIYTVVGVMPASFRFPNDAPVDVWAIRTLAPTSVRPPYFLFSFGRLRSGISRPQAEAELAIIAGQVSRQFPGAPDVIGTMQPLKAWMVQRAKPALLVMQCAVIFVLLIALVNVSNLLLSRASTRQREMALRLALGAGRHRLIRQLLTESLFLAMAGGAIGLALASAAVSAFVHFGPGGLARIEEVGINLRVLSFTGASALAAGILFGFVPAMQSTRAPLHDALRSSTPAGGSRPGERLRRVLVAAELTLTLMLMIGASLLIRSFLRLRQVSPGFEPDHLITMQLSLPHAHYEKEAQIVSFWRDFLQAIEAIPGVRAAGITMSLPPNLLNITNPFTIEGQPYDRSRALPLAEEMTVSPDYFRALGVPLLRGRVFSDADGRPATSDPKAKTPMVVMINEAMARRFFPHSDPIGKRLQTGDPDPKSPWETIVGVVGDVKYSGLDSPPTPQLYVPYREEGWASWSREMFVVVRTNVDPVSVLPPIRSQLTRLDPVVPLADVRTMDQLLDESLTQQRFRGLLIGGFAAMALALAAIGLYGVISYFVTQRTHEIGLRMALGAQPSDVLRLVIRQAVQIALIGIAIGLAGAFAVTRMLKSLLFGISPSDSFSFLLTTMVLALVVLLGSYVPARRAMNVDPMESLRYE